MVRVDEDRLLELAVEGDLVVRIVPLMGDFVAKGGPVLDIWSQEATSETSRLLDTIAFADERTIEQDAAFGFRQIVDIAERALSPGVNDPTTAVQGDRPAPRSPPLSGSTKPCFAIPRRR